MTVELVNLSDGLSCYTTSEGEARLIYTEIYEDHCYDGFKLPESPFIVDAGANIGLFSLYMKQKYPLATILAFEPAPETCDILHRNLELNNVAGVETHACGLSSKATAAKLTYFPHLPGNSTTRPEEKVEIRRGFAQRVGEEIAAKVFGDAQEVDIRLQRLSHFLDACKGLERIDLIKVDVEGAELDVLLGMDDKYWEMVCNVVLETCIDSGVKPAIEEILHDKGFIVTTEAAPLLPEKTFIIRAYRDS
ncbi:methyltransferase sdnD [Colletotrichum spaethianum]|uniref:Methyltransferase sdnD n=1 Tax=Colletotrichum spaethianum TaxID=700344 RepID=A0AA37UKP6_9PEZI|nr:methyltransferase sdnD [Colletotrichum spaethianum]GKT50416.1 methyltransferase sdnD [Colletotrichum spaethianum]